MKIWLVTWKVRIVQKRKRQLFQKSKEYKTSRSTDCYAKFAEAHRSQLEEVKTGTKYETEVAITLAKKITKSAPKRNPEGTLPSDWKCPYHRPKFCFVKGHHDFWSGNCRLHGKSKEERDEVLAIIMNEAIVIQVDTNARKGKNNYWLIIIIHFFFIILT